MRSAVEPLEGNKVKLSVEVDEGEFDKALDAAFRRIAREVRIPGFRPGKAPRQLLEARMGPEVARQEALRESLPEYYAKALREHEVDAIAPPEIDITAGEQDGPVVFDAVVEVRPTIQVPGYQGLTVTIPSPHVAEEEIDAQVDRLRKQSGELREVSRPAQIGDHATIDVTGSRGGEELPGLTASDYLYEIGSATVVPELDEQLRSAKAGDILQFDADVPGDEEGDPLTLRVLVKDVKEMVLPDVTDEWAAEASELESVAALRDDVRTRLGMMKKAQAMLSLRESAVDSLVQLVGDDPPEPLVAQEMERRLHDLAHRMQHQGATMAQYLEATGQSQDELIEGLREGATGAVKADLALRAVADAEGIEVDDAELDEEIGRLAERLGRKPAQLRRELERNEQVPSVRSDVRKAKALQWLFEHVSLVDEQGTAIDRDELKMPEQKAAGQQPAEEEST